MWRHTYDILKAFTNSFSFFCDHFNFCYQLFFISWSRKQIILLQLSVAVECWGIWGLSSWVPTYNIIFISIWQWTFENLPWAKRDVLFNLQPQPSLILISFFLASINILHIFSPSHLSTVCFLSRLSETINISKWLIRQMDIVMNQHLLNIMMIPLMDIRSTTGKQLIGKWGETLGPLHF